MVQIDFTFLENFEPYYCIVKNSLIKFSDSVLSGGLVSYDLNCFYFNTRHIYIHIGNTTKDRDLYNISKELE